MKHKRVKHSIRCLKAIEAYVGGRERLSTKLGVGRSTIDKWVREGKVSGKHVLKLRELSDDRFGTDELLGGHDN